jgi:hypothetical protein
MFITGFRFSSWDVNAIYFGPAVDAVAARLREFADCDQLKISYPTH